MKKEIKRCDWGTDPLMQEYHDTDWGAPLHDDIGHFELIILEGAQAGLSWSTVLKKRENYRKAFRGFDPARVSKFNKRDIERLLKNEGIIRNRLKIESAVSNAKAFLAIQKEFGSFDEYIWEFVDGRPIVNSPKSFKEVPPTTELSDTISKDLKKRGFRFVGSTIVYAYLQAAGLVNDHLVDCFRYRELKRAE